MTGRDCMATDNSDPRFRGTVLVMPGGAFQVPLIRKAQSMGLRVATADRSSTCAAAHGVADLFLPIGVDDRHALLRAAQKLQPCAVLTDQTDAAVATVAWLAKELRLPGIGDTCAELFTQKPLMRSFGLAHGFPTPEFHVCSSLKDALEAADALRYPVVIKPTDGQSSKGVNCVRSAAEMARHFACAAHHARRGDIIVETFLDGPEFTVEGFMTRTGHHTLGVSEKQHYTSSPMVACSLLYSPSHPHIDYSQLRRQHDRWMNLAGLPFGMTHAEYKWVSGTFYLIEVAARGGGTRISSDIVPWLAMTDTQQLLVNEALGTPSKPTPFTASTRHALLEFFTFPTGRVASIHGVAEAKALPGVHDVVMNIAAGGISSPLTDDTARPGYFILLTESREDLESARKHVLATVTATVN